MSYYICPRTDGVCKVTTQPLHGVSGGCILHCSTCGRSPRHVFTTDAQRRAAREKYRLVREAYQK
jgi:hypothetical protein